MAEEIAQFLDEYALDAHSQEPMSESQSFRAHLAILQNKTALALEWAQSRVYQHVKRPYFWTEAPRRSRAFMRSSQKARQRVWIALPSCCRLRSNLHQHGENKWREVELLALQAVLLSAQGDQKEALNTLELALGIARPGHFVRSFVDLGPKLRDLLAALIREHRQADYASELLHRLRSSRSQAKAH